MNRPVNIGFSVPTPLFFQHLRNQQAKVTSMLARLGEQIKPYMVLVRSLSVRQATCFDLILIFSLECNEMIDPNVLTKSTEHLDSGLVGFS